MTVTTVDIEARSDDPDVVLSTFDAVYPSSIVGRMDRGANRFRWESHTTDDVVFTNWGMTAPISVETDYDDLWVYAAQIGHGAHAEQDRTSIDLDGPILYPSGPWSLAWAGDFICNAVSFSGTAANEVARSVTGDDRLVVHRHGGHPISAQHRQLWHQAWSYGFANLRVIAETPSEILEAETRRLMIIISLTSFPTTLAALSQPDENSRPVGRIVRRARAFIDENAHRPITVDDVARAVGMSTRGLQAAFQRDTGESPMGYVRRTRLDSARQALLTANPQTDTVAAIARHWGFAHAGRFSQTYYEHYGVLPREDLHRGEHP
jgi:AraC-like DNA-binding protein